MNKIFYSNRNKFMREHQHFVDHPESFEIPYDIDTLDGMIAYCKDNGATGFFYPTMSVADLKAHASHDGSIVMCKKLPLSKIKLSVDGGTAFEDFLGDLCDHKHHASIIEDINHCHATVQGDGTLMIYVYVHGGEFKLHIEPTHFEIKI